MTTPRTQTHRHWVQVEYAPTGSNRRVFHIDLNMVDEVIAVVESIDPNKVEAVKIYYAGQMKPIVLENTGSFTGPSAQWFWDTWVDFISLNAVQAAAPVGLIHRPDGVNVFQ